MSTLHANSAARTVHEDRAALDAIWRVKKRGVIRSLWSSARGADGHCGRFQTCRSGLVAQLCSLCDLVCCDLTRFPIFCKDKRSSCCAVGSVTCRMDHPEALLCKERCGVEWRWNQKNHSLHKVHTRNQAPSIDVGLLERVLVRSKISDDKPDFWLGGHLVTKTQTSSLSRKTEVCGTTVRSNTVPMDAVLQTIMNFRMRSER